MSLCYKTEPPTLSKEKKETISNQYQHISRYFFLRSEPEKRGRQEGR